MEATETATRPQQDAQRSTSAQAGSGAPGGPGQGSTQQSQFSDAPRQPGSAQASWPGGDHHPQGRPERSVARRGSAAPAWMGRDPFDLVRQIDQNFDRAIAQLFGSPRARLFGRGQDQAALWAPALELVERGGEIQARLDLPGVRKEDVQIHVENGQLIVQGERSSSREEGSEESQVWHSERSYGSFLRSVPLPDGVDPATARASFKDGVLEVRFEAPKPAAGARRAVEISG